MFSGFVIAHVASSNDDGEVLKGIFNIRRLLNGLPARVIADNAIFTPRSASLAFLKQNNVEITHGMAYISRCQSHAERMIGTLTRLVTKLHTDSPTTQFTRLVDEACIIIIIRLRTVFPMD